MASVVAAALALALTLVGTRWWIAQPWAARQPVRSDGPASHQSKAGTPTMGGVVFTAGMVAAVALTGSAGGRTGWAVIGLVVAMAAIGFADDWVKVRRRKPLGLRARGKMIAGVVVATAFALVVPASVRVVRLPLAGGTWHAPLWAFVLLVDLVVAASANGANLTDGLDGLAAGVSLPILAFLALAAFALGERPEGTIALVLLAALLAFLAYNRHPARLIMGDTGAFAIGGAMAGLAVATGWEVLLPVAAAVLVAETLSVILQVISFRTTGRRIFRMSPLHHHFELGGWSEPQVVTRFVLSSLFACGLAGLLWGVRL